MSRSSSQHTIHPRESMASGNIVTDTDASIIPPPPIPTVLPPPTESPITPLPALPMSVLSITMLGEFLSSNVSTPFLLFMVKGFGFPDEADAAFWTGILVAMFFLSQFLTSLLWATLAEKYGRRFVLVLTLFGSAVSVSAFGFSTTITQAICIRMVQGVFAGAVGVARGSVVFVTNSSNEGRAYAILGFFWGFGGLLGPIIGGAFERPAERWPIFHQWKLFQQFPYLLPSVVAGLILLAGSILACFLGRDGGLRQGTIHSHPEKIEVGYPNSSDIDEQPAVQASRGPSLAGSLRRKKISGYFSTNSGGLVESAVPSSVRLSSHYPRSSSRSSGIPIGHRTRTMSSSRSNYDGYRGSLGRTSGSVYRQMLANAIPFQASHSGSLPASRDYYSPREDDTKSPAGNDVSDTRSIAEMIFMANENAVNSIADLWVAAALNVDEAPFEDESEAERDDNDVLHLEDGQVEPRGRRSSRRGNNRHSTRLASVASSQRINATPQRRSSRQPSATTILAAAPIVDLVSESFVPQSLDNVFASRQSFPSIFINTGVGTPPVVTTLESLNLSHQHEPHFSEGNLIVPPSERELPPILESRRPSEMHLNELGLSETTPLLGMDVGSESLPLPIPVRSMVESLPVVVIAQFGLLALHTTMHDQVFMSYLVSAFEAGGLGLAASDFAQLIALMGIAQIIFQFYLYPNVGSPRGPLSHLTMYRLGTFLFIPAYLTVVLYRTPFAHPDGLGKFALMTALALSTVVRYCAITFSFTSISVLLNYMSPPETVGYANGLAQTIVSLARCLGPVLGGWLWSVSVEGHPSGYPYGFVVCAIVCGFATLATIFIK